MSHLSRVARALGLADTASVADIEATIQARRREQDADARSRRVLAELRPWLEDAVDVRDKVGAMWQTLCITVDLDPETASLSEVAERIADVFAARDTGDVAAVAVVKRIGSSVFRARVDRLRAADRDLTFAEAQRAVSREDPELFAAAMGR